MRVGFFSLPAPVGLIDRGREELAPTTAAKAGAALDFGLSGDSAFSALLAVPFPGRESEAVTDADPDPPSPPVTRRRFCGRPTLSLAALLRLGLRELFAPAPVGAGVLLKEGAPEGARTDMAASPRRAFSCFACTIRKWERRSCHLILSSLPSFDLIAEGCGALQPRYAF